MDIEGENFVLNRVEARALAVALPEGQHHVLWPISQAAKLLVMTELLQSNSRQLEIEAISFPAGGIRNAMEFNARTGRAVAREVISKLAPYLPSPAEEFQQLLNNPDAMSD